MDFHIRFGAILAADPAFAQGIESYGETFLEGVIDELNGIPTGRSLVTQVVDELLRREALVSAAPDARRIPIDERYYMPRSEPWLPGEYIPRPYYDDDDIGLNRAIDAQRLLGRPLTWCQKTGEPLTY
jgi:hypothetical protein